MKTSSQGTILITTYTQADIRTKVIFNSKETLYH
jgi:hypothetical protein